MLAEIAFTTRNAQVSEKFTYSIIILARREKYKKYQKTLKNYETSGHSLDTITLKSSMPNIISNRPFYSAHSTYLRALYPQQTFLKATHTIFGQSAISVSRDIAPQCRKLNRRPR